jgi:hypothetical protein
VTIGEDNPAVRDFLSMLPLSLTLEEFNGPEKIAYLPRKLAHAGRPARLCSPGASFVVGHALVVDGGGTVG